MPRFYSRVDRDGLISSLYGYFPCPKEGASYNVVLYWPNHFKRQFVLCLPLKPVYLMIKIVKKLLQSKLHNFISLDRKVLSVIGLFHHYLVLHD